MHITVEDQISPPGECGIGTLTQNRKGARMDMWLVVAMQRNSFGIPWVKEYLWIVSQGCNTEGFTWSARERLSHAVTSLSLYFQIVSTVFRTFRSILHHSQCWSFLAALVQESRWCFHFCSSSTICTDCGHHAAAFLSACMLFFSVIFIWL